MPLLHGVAASVDGWLVGLRKSVTARGEESLPIEGKTTCTEGQVFHKRYREKEAKIGAKVEPSITCLFIASYEERIWKLPVLGA
jgi:hypothetical protein